jgi:2-keto-3-deoxy-galactonokinase
MSCRRSLIAQHQAKVEEAIEQAKALRKAMKSGQMAAKVTTNCIFASHTDNLLQEIQMANQMGSMLMGMKSSRANLSSGVRYGDQRMQCLTKMALL